MSKEITFDAFQPGKVLGENVEIYSAELAKRWQRIFGAHSAAEGAGLAVVMMMRAYINVVTPRPPGNIHAQQSFSLNGTPKRGESIRTVVTCTGKEMKRERRYVQLQTVGTGDESRPLFNGIMTMIWTA